MSCAVYPCTRQGVVFLLQPASLIQPSHLRVRFFSIPIPPLLVGFWILSEERTQPGTLHNCLLNNKYILHIIAIMPFSNSKRRQIFSTLSSIVENSFLDETSHDAVAGVVPSPKIPRRVKRRTAKKVTRRHLQSFIVIYTMIFFNGCE